MSSRKYTRDEKRVCEFIQELTNKQVGCGDDPIGFLISSYRSVMAERDRLRKEVKKLTGKDWQQNVHDTFIA